MINADVLVSFSQEIVKQSSGGALNRMLIGGALGAGAGALASGKENRSSGALLGGALGAGAGLAVGRGSKSHDVEALADQMRRSGDHNRRLVRENARMRANDEAARRAARRASDDKPFLSSRSPR